jgi:hypothetical protein
VDQRDTTKTGPAINYSRGNRITLTMLKDRIDRVVVAGAADGVHLEPRPAVAADSARRAHSDSLRTQPPRPTTP